MAATRPLNVSNNGSHWNGSRCGKNVTVDNGSCFCEDIPELRFFSFYGEHVLPVYCYVLNGCGIIGSLCIVLTIFHANYRYRPSFRCFSITIALADLTFGVCSIALAIMPDNKFCNDEQDAYFWATELVFGTMAGVSSMFSDCTTLLLTFERFAIRYPIYWHSRSQTWKARLSACCISMALVVGMVPIYRSFAERLQPISENPKELIVTATEFSCTKAFKVLDSFYHFVLPMLLSATTLCLTVSFSVTLHARTRVLPRNNRGTNDPSVPRRCHSSAADDDASCSLANVECTRQSMRRISAFMYVTAVTSVVHQIIFAAAWIFAEDYSKVDCSHDVPYDSEALTNLAAIWIRKSYAIAVDITWNAFVRNNMFYMYLLFGKTFRQEFQEQLAMLRALKLRSVPDHLRSVFGPFLWSANKGSI